MYFKASMEVEILKTSFNVNSDTTYFFIHLLSKHLMSTYYVSDTVPDTWDVAVKR